MDFGEGPRPAIPFTTGLDDVSIAADRWTSRLTPAAVRSHAAPGVILIHAIDADLSVPILLYWLLLHAERLMGMVAHFKGRVDLRLVLPTDLPGRWQARFRRVPGIEWVDPKYPAGHWRMLPHVLGMQRRSPLVLDAVAGVDLALALSGEVSVHRPVAICDLERTRPIEYKLARRDDRITDLLPPHERWIAGPRWRRREAPRDTIVGDGEVVFFADHQSPEKQSPCIRCGWCEYICPTRCSPAEFLRAQRDHDLARAHRAGLNSCINCGLCTNVCPSNLPLYQFIDRLREAQRTEAR